MRARLQDEQGFGLIELMAAVTVLSIAVLALMGSFDSIFLSSRAAKQNTSAGLIAEKQLELYGTHTASTYSTVALDATTYTSTQASDSTYAADEATVVGSNAIKTISGCGTSATCLPVQTVTGSNGKSYTLESFVYDVQNPNAPTGVTWTERTVTVIVRDPSASGSPIVAEETTAIDPGPS